MINKNLKVILDTVFCIMINQLQMKKFAKSKKQERPKACNKKSDI